MGVLPALPLLLITDRHQAGPRSLEWVIAAALEGGIRWISLREKDLDHGDRLDLLRRILALTKACGATLMVHDDVLAAARLELDGIHLPEFGDAARARALLPQGLIGQSWHGDPGRGMLSDPALDYLSLSPIFLTESKPGYGPALGPAGLERATGLTKKPLVGLGGIAADNVALCRGAGAAGVAVMGEVMRAVDPARVAATLVARLAAP